MVGANPKANAFGRAQLAAMPALPRHAFSRAHFARRGLSLLTILVPLSLTLASCGQSPTPGSLAANVQGSTGDDFDDRFPRPQFNDRFPTAAESLQQRPANTADAQNRRTSRSHPKRA